MKIGIISDIHGNFEALKTVLAELDRMSITEIYCLGDVVGYYTQVNECCEELRRRKILNLMGNHDWYMASGGFCPRSKSVNDCLVYQRQVIKQENIDWLRTSAVQRFVRNIHMVHGGWADPIDEYLVEPNAEYFERIHGEIFMSGHTHLQSLHYFGNKIYCNPGSVGQPRITLHRLEYNIEEVFNLMKAAGFNDYYYGGLLTGARNLTRLPQDYPGNSNTL